MSLPRLDEYPLGGRGVGKNLSLQPRFRNVTQHDIKSDRPSDISNVAINRFFMTDYLLIASLVPISPSSSM